MSKRTQLSLAVAASAIGFAALPTAAHAQAFYLQEQSSRGAGRAFSGEVADTGAPSLWWNPAAIAGIDRPDAAISVSAILPKGDVVDNGTVIRRPGQTFAPIGGDPISSDPISKGVLPSGAFAYPINDRIAVGLAITSPYSFTTDYDDTSWARYSATKTKLRTFDIQPSIGVVVTDWLRVGAALNVEYSDATLSNALPNVLASLPDGQQRLKGDGWDLGWTAGFQMHNDVVTVGFAYKSAIEHKLKGDVEISGLLGPLAASNATLSGIEASFYTPAQIILGARVKATDKLTLNGQAVRYTWNKFDAIRLGAPLNAELPQNYRNSYSLAGGVDYDVSPRFTVRAGVQRALTPTQDGERDARVPDSNRWNYSAGGTFKATDSLSFDVGAAYIDFADATIDRVTAAYVGTAAQTPIITNGELQDARAIVLTAGARMRF